jgi:hypothetical protein
MSLSPRRAEIPIINPIGHIIGDAGRCLIHQLGEKASLIVTTLP